MGYHLKGNKTLFRTWSRIRRTETGTLEAFIVNVSLLYKFVKLEGRSMEERKTIIIIIIIIFFNYKTLLTNF